MPPSGTEPVRLVGNKRSLEAHDTADLRGLITSRGLFSRHGRTDISRYHTSRLLRLPPWRRTQSLLHTPKPTAWWNRQWAVGIFWEGGCLHSLGRQQWQLDMARKGRLTLSAYLGPRQHGRGG